MTKDEMLKKYAMDNYNVIQEHIKDAMKKGERHIYVGMEWSHDFKPEWVCLDSTKDMLIDDGFEVESADFDEWKISW